MGGSANTEEKEKVPATTGRGAVQHRAKVGWAAGEASLGTGRAAGSCRGRGRRQHQAGGSGESSGRLLGATSGATWAAGWPPHPGGSYLLLLHTPQSLTDEPDVLACERAQLTVAGTQIHVLGGGREEAPRVSPAPADSGSAHPPALPLVSLTSWMMLSDPDWTLGFLAGEATGSSCALYVTS